MALDNPTPARADSPIKPNIGVFLCKCGKNIGGSVDVDSLAQAVEALAAVKLVQLNTYTCSEPGQAEIEAAIAVNKLEKIVVAGAFGTYIDIGSAIRVGMFPEIPLGRFHQVGNAAGAGAKDLLISTDLRRKANEIKDRVEYIELTTHQACMTTFLERMYF